MDHTENVDKKYRLSVMSKKRYNEILKTLQDSYPENIERADQVMGKIREIMNCDPSTTPGYTKESGKRFSEWRRKQKNKKIDVNQNNETLESEHQDNNLKQ